jgi:hypothetical protein
MNKRQWIKTLPCYIKGCDNRDIDPAHIRTAANSGTGIKPDDRWMIPLCRYHHIEIQHQHGYMALLELNGLNLSRFEAKQHLLTACENYEKQFLIFCKKDT